MAAGLGTAAWSAGLSSQSYVQDGLIVQFDAIENVGVGQPHDASATVWKDLKGSASITLPSGVTWIDRGLAADNKDLTTKGMPAFYLDSVSSELTMERLASGPSGYPRLFFHPGGDGMYTIHMSNSGSEPWLYIEGRNAPRPGFGPFTMGTLGVKSDTASYLTYQNGVLKGSSYDSSTKTYVACGHTLAAATDEWKFNRQNNSTLRGNYRSFRHYNRGLTASEFAHNFLVDRFRFYSFATAGAGLDTPVAWTSLTWAAPYDRTDTAPLANTNDIAVVRNAKVAVTAANDVALQGLSLEDGSSLVLAADAAVRVQMLFVEGKAVCRGVYTGSEGTLGTAVDWISGAGQVLVAGEGNTRFPHAVNGLGAANYVQDGLIAQFDAVDNEGTGVHNNSAAVWRDLAGKATLTLTNNAKWIDRALDSGASNQDILNMPAFYYDSVFTELAVKIISHAGAGTYPRLFYHTSGDNCYSVYHQGDGDQMCFFMGGQSTSRPSFYFSDGTLSLGSDCTNIRVYVNGSGAASSGSFKVNHVLCPANTWNLDRYGQVPSHFRSIRHYNRALTVAEIAHNRQIDVQRFESYLFTGDGSAVNWSAITWLKPERGGSGDSPSSATNEYATVANAAVKIAASDAVALAGLSLEYGATIEVAAGTVVGLKLLYVNGKEVARGVYTADGRGGSLTADWMTGAGEVRVAGGPNRGVPYIPAAAADGWYEYGILNGKCGPKWTVGERPIWENYWFPAGAKLRLKGWLLLDTVPDVFADYDTTQLKRVYVNGTRAYAADRPFEVPEDIIFRFTPGDWRSYANNSNAVSNLDNSLMTQTSGDVVLAKDASFHVWGDGLPNLTYSGILSGTGILAINSYGRQMRFTGGFACDAKGGDNWQNGSGLWIDTLAVTSSLQTVTLSSCGDSHGMTTTYSASFLMFGKANSAATADHPLNIARLNGNASSRVDSKGKRWRSGGHLLVWGSNTVHVGALHAGLHVVADRKDQHCDNGFLNGSYAGTVPGGIGFLTVDNFNTGTIYGSTNVALTIGTIAANTAIDYTYQSNAVNRLTLDITNACDTATTIKATDLAMLPARISGFKGSVRLTETETRSYEMPLDLAAGPEALYNTVGCNGSGTLVAAPQNGSINVTFPTTGIEPVPGKYGIARFSAGGELLKNWTVTLNGEKVTDMNVNGHNLTLRKNSKGIWLGVDLPGCVIIIK